MKKLGIVIAAALFSTGLVAQKEIKKKSPEEKALFQTEKIAAELSLTEDQKSQIKDINLKINEKNASLDEALMTAEERKKGKKANNDARKEMIKALLTPEQSAQLEIKLKEREAEKMKRIENRKVMMKEKLKENNSEKQISKY